MANAASYESTPNIDPSLRDSSDYDMAAPYYSPPSRSQAAGSTWQEPAPRQAVPSFMDYRGLERHGVLEGMMPLGSLPSSKIKARARMDPLRRAMQARHAELGGADEGRSTPDILTPVVESTRAGSYKTDEASRPASPAVTTLPPASGSPELLSSSVDTRRSSDDLVAHAGSLDHDASLPDIPPRELLLHQSPRTPRQSSSVFTPFRATTMQHHSPVHSNVTPLPSAPQRTPMQPGTIFDRAFKEASRRSRPELGNAIPWLHIAAQQDLDFAKALFEVSKPNATVEQRLNYDSRLHDIKKRVKSYIKNPTAAQNPFPFRNLNASSSNNTARALHSPPHSSTDNKAHSLYANNNSPFNSQSSPNSQSHTTTKSGNGIIRLKYSGATPSQTVSPRRRPRSPSQTSPTPIVSQSDHAMASITEPELGSPGSSSALSELDQEDLEDGPEPSSAGRVQPTQGPTVRLTMSSATSSAAPASSVSSRKRPADTANEDLDPLVIERESRKKRLRSAEADVAVYDSDVRTSVQQTASRPKQEQDSTPRVIRTMSGTGFPQGLSPAVANMPPPTALGRPPKRAAKPNTPRTKTSPQKTTRQSATIAGVPQGTRRNGPVGYDDNQEQLENSDYCAACSGAGYLICCDGCDRSFHLSCLDPPVESDSELDEPWFCYTCRSNRFSTDYDPKKPWSELIDRLEAQNPTAFQLPRHIQNFFEDTTAGPDGEYSEEPKKPTITLRSTRTGADVEPDSNRLRDNKGKTITCTYCGGSALGHRQVVQCSYCQEWWHLDCTDPPLNVAPRGRPWMCPRHVDNDLRALDSLEKHAGISTSIGVPTHRIRRPRNALLVDPAFPRGHRNNGDIEVADEPETTDEEEEVEDSDDDSDASEFMEEVQGKGKDAVRYRLPRKAIKLDFIDKVHLQRQAEFRRDWHKNQKLDLRKKQLEMVNMQIVNANLRLQNEVFSSRTQTERDAAALVNVQKRQPHEDFSGSNKIQTLINTLLTEASSESLALMSDSEIEAARRAAPLSLVTSRATHDEREGLPDSFGEVPLDKQEREDLLRLQMIISRRLATNKKPAPASQRRPYGALESSRRRL